MILGIPRIGDTRGGREIGTGKQRRDIYGAVQCVLKAFCTSYPAHLGATDVSLL